MRTIPWLLCLALCFPAAARGQATLFVGDAWADGMRIHADDLYWKAGCGGDFTPSLSRVQAVAAAAPDASGARTLYEPPACGGGRVASKNIAIDDQYVYWITGDGRVARLPLGSVRGTAETLYAAGPANASGYFIAVSGDDVLWSNGTTVTRAARAGGSTPQVVVDAGRGLRDVRELTAAAGNRYFFLDGRRLYAMYPVGGGSSFVTFAVAVGSDTGAFAVHGNELVMATGARGAYTIYSFPIDNTTAPRTLYTASADAHPDQHVDQIALDDANLYWHVVVDRGGGPILRLPRLFPVSTPISEYVLMLSNDRMQSNGEFLFWAEVDGIHRLPVGAAHTRPVTPDAEPFTMTDISPDRPYGSPGTDYPPNGADPAGMVISVAVDPNNSLVVFAATERAGVWKSVDAGASWRQSSAGLRTGLSRGIRSIAIDERNSQRLLYASEDDDSRPGHPFGGLYRSLSGGASWEHVQLLPDCHPDPALWKVAFGAGRGYAMTRCGIFWSDDLTEWRPAPLPSTVTADSVTTLAVRGRTVFLCSGQSVYRSIDSARSWERTALTAPGRCDDMSEAPIDEEPEPAALVLWENANQWFEVALLDFRAGTVSDLGFHQTGQSDSGVPLVFAARRPGTSLAVPGPDAAFDVFASNRDYFFQLTSSGGWTRIEPVHWDTHGMAFPANYDPPRGNCRAYVATDGGVFAGNASMSSRTPCVTAGGPWIRSQSGLHGLHAFEVVGVPPLLFVTSGHNNTWVTPSGGVPGSSWQLADQTCCGDTGLLLMDPAAPGRLMVGRGGPNMRRIYQVPPGATWPRTAVAEISRPGMSDGLFPPAQGTTAQVFTAAGEAVPAEGDYISVDTPAGGRFTSILRNQTSDAGAWRPLSTDYFASGSVTRVQVSGGHAAPTVYAQTTDGRIHAGTVDGTGVIPRWEVISTGLMGPLNFYANPYVRGMLYVTDRDGEIKVTTNNGGRWDRVPELTSIASHDGEFRTGCADRFCSLQDLVFVRNNPRMIIAVLWPGGIAVSPDAGRHWFPITEGIRGLGSLAGIYSFRDLLARPYAALYDPSGGPGGEGVLYVTLKGRGLIRIDGPFSRLARRIF
jgi:hypothetical protein